MTKKNFTGGINSLLGDQKPKPRKRFETGDEKPTRKRFETGDEKPTRKRLEGKIKNKVGRPQTQFKEITKSSQEGTKENETRATFIVNEDLLDKIKLIAYWDRVLIKDVINGAFKEAVERYEKKNGPLKQEPKK